MSEDSDNDFSSSEEEADVSPGHNDAGQMDHYFQWAYASVRGQRETNEDTQVVTQLKDNDVAVVGVFDGHGGHLCSRFCAKHLPKILNDKEDLSDESIKTAFKELDVEYLEELEDDGSCVCIALVQQTETSDALVVANLGDSRALLLPATASSEIQLLTTDHKPDVAAEKARIEATGATVSMERIVQHGKRVNVARVDGQLAISRAIGDDSLKESDMEPEEQAVSPVPDVTRYTWAPGDVLVIACDGLWDVCTNTQVESLIRAERNAGKSLEAVAHTLCDLALSNKSDDNVTVVLALRTGDKKEQPGQTKVEKIVESEPDEGPKDVSETPVDVAEVSKEHHVLEPKQKEEEKPQLIIPHIGVIPTVSSDSLIVIRQYVQEDAAQCAYVYACAWRPNLEIYDILCPQPRHHAAFVSWVNDQCESYTLGKIAAILQKKKSCVFVAEVDGVVCGTVSITYNPSIFYGPHIPAPHAEVTHLAIHPAVSGRGLASALLDACEWHCKENAIKTMWLDVASFQKPAVRLYQKRDMHLACTISVNEGEKYGNIVVQQFRFVLAIKSKKTELQKIHKKLAKVEKELKKAKKERKQLKKKLRRLQKK